MPGDHIVFRDMFPAIRRLDEVLRGDGLMYCIIGGIAVAIRGQPRFTRDVDVTVLVDPKWEESVLDLILERFAARRDNAKEFALQTKVVLLSVKGVPVDLAMGLSQFQHETVQRATMVSFAVGLPIPVCGAEDLIIHKCIAGRAEDLLDICSIGGGILVWMSGRFGQRCESSRNTSIATTWKSHLTGVWRKLDVANQRPRQHDETSGNPPTASSFPPHGACGPACGGRCCLLAELFPSADGAGNLAADV